MNTKTSASTAIAFAVYFLMLSSTVTAELGVSGHHDPRGHGRMIRKRGLFDLPNPAASPAAASQPATPANPVGDPNQDQPGAGGNGVASPSSAASASTPSATPSSDNNPLGPILSGIFGGGQSTTAVQSTTAASVSSTLTKSVQDITLSPTTTRAVSSTSTTSSSSSTSSSASSSVAPSIVVIGGHTSTALVQQTAVAPASGATVAQTKNSVNIARGTIIALVAIGASIGAIFLISTAIRKWKLKSRSLEDRTNINWDPQADQNGIDDIMEKRNRARPASDMSFGSTDAHGNPNYGAAAGAQRGFGGQQPQHQPVDYDLQHDFTAGPGQVDPNMYQSYHHTEAYHTGGPAPFSSSPPMVENNLTRGGSLTRPGQHEDIYAGFEDAYDDGMAPHHAPAGHMPPQGVPPAHQF